MASATPKSTKSTTIMKRFFLPLSLLLSLLPLSASAQSGRFTCATMNVDGLPPTIQFSILGKDYNINVNPDGREDAGARAIAEKMVSKSVDFLGVNEDFNYHTALMEPFTAKGYVAYSHSGGMSVKEAGGVLMALLNYGAKKPLVHADGLNLICRKTPGEGFPQCSASGEQIVAWNDAYGYLDHDNDALTNKGFRYYRVTTGSGTNSCELDVYVLHMDAGSGWQDGDDGDIKVREKQMTQLVTYIKKKVSTRPMIIMGDFNSYYTRDRLKELFVDPLNQFNGGQLTVGDSWVETSHKGEYPVYDLAANGYNGHEGECIDKIIYVNNAQSPVQLVLERYTLDRTFVDASGASLSDHNPVFAQFAFYATPISIGTVVRTIRDVQNGRASKADLDRETQQLLRAE